MTAAIRAVEHTKQGEKDIKKLASAFKNRAYKILSGSEEATLVGEAVKLVCPKGWITHKGKKTSMAFAAIGGGSVELGVITPEGDIENALALPLGIITLKEESDGKIDQAGKIFNSALKKHYREDKHKILAVIGGNWRGLGEAVCHPHRLPTVLEGKKIRSTLLQATRYGEKYYRSLGGRPQKRAAFMSMSAAMLRRVAKHFGAKKIIFLESTIRDAMAQQMHALNTGRLTSASPGLERLFSPSVQAQSRPA
jgi:exopolyphosphatase/pppGpp-phosphohydrolase